MGVQFVAVASALPDRVVGNGAIAQRLGVSESWIESRTGIRERRYADPGTTVADLATLAAERALTQAQLTGVDLVLVATSSADDLVPAVSPHVAERLGGAAAIDVSAACTGWISALALATGLLEAGRAGTALVIGAEIMSRLLDPDDRRTAALFGDGAGAAVLRAGPGASDIAPVVLRSDASGAGAIVIGRCDSRVRMDGHFTFQQAVRRLAEITDEALEAAQRCRDEIDLYVYHQANGRILGAVGERLGLPGERVLSVVDRYANTSAASIPIALADAQASGRLRDGDRLLLAAFGAGFTWGGTVVRWCAAP